MKLRSVGVVILLVFATTQVLVAQPGKLALADIPAPVAVPLSAGAKAPSSALANAFTYQGQLKVNGNPVNATCNITFKLFSAPTSGTQAGPTVTQPVTVTNGLFTTQLALGAAFQGGDALWLEITPDCGAGAVTLSPRQLLTAAPYSFFSAAPWVTSGSNLSYNFGNVGIGTTTPSQKLAVVGVISTTGGIQFPDGTIQTTAATQAQNDARYARISPTTQQIALLKWYTAISTTQSNISVGGAPWAIAFDGANMWVANYNSWNVKVIRVSDGYTVMTPATGAYPEGIAFDGINMWVANYYGNNISVLRASDGYQVMTPTTGTYPAAVAFDGVNMWVANSFQNNTVSVLRASDGYHVMTPTVGSEPYSLAFDGVNMWAPNTVDNNVSVLRASDGYHVMTPTVGLYPIAIAFDGANMWVANNQSNTVSVLRASDGYNVMTITVGLHPHAIAFDGANMWVTNAGDGVNPGAVSVLRASDGSLVKTVSVGVSPQAIAFDGAYMWVANTGSNTVSKR